MSEVPLYRNLRPNSGLELLKWFESTRERWTSQIGPFIFMVLTYDCSVQSRVITDISIRFLGNFPAKFIGWMARRPITRVLCVQGFLVDENHPGEAAMAPSSATWLYSNPSNWNPKEYTLYFKPRTLATGPTQTPGRCLSPRCFARTRGRQGGQ